MTDVDDDTPQSYLQAARETVFFFLLEKSEHLLCLQWRAYLDDEFLMSMHHQVATIPANSNNIDIKVLRETYIRVLLGRGLLMVVPNDPPSLNILELVVKYPILDAPIRSVIQEPFFNTKLDLNHKTMIHHKEFSSNFLELMDHMQKHSALTESSEVDRFVLNPRKSIDAYLFGSLELVLAR